MKIQSPFREHTALGDRVVYAPDTQGHTQALPVFVGRLAGSVRVAVGAEAVCSDCGQLRQETVEKGRVETLTGTVETKPPIQPGFNIHVVRPAEVPEMSLGITRSPRARAVPCAQPRREAWPPVWWGHGYLHTRKDSPVPRLLKCLKVQEKVFQ